MFAGLASSEDSKRFGDPTLSFLRARQQPLLDAVSGCLPVNICEFRTGCPRQASGSSSQPIAAPQSTAAALLSELLKEPFSYFCSAGSPVLLVLQQFCSELLGWLLCFSLPVQKGVLYEHTKQNYSYLRHMIHVLCTCQSLLK